MDLRDFVALCEKEGELKRVKAEVDWNLEISHIAKIVEQKSGPALLFEKVKGYDSSVFTGAFGTRPRGWPWSSAKIQSSPWWISPGNG